MCYYSYMQESCFSCVSVATSMFSWIYFNVIASFTQTLWISMYFNQSTILSCIICTVSTERTTMDISHFYLLRLRSMTWRVYCYVYVAWRDASIVVHWNERTGLSFSITLYHVTQYKSFHVKYNSNSNHILYCNYIFIFTN